MDENIKSKILAEFQDVCVDLMLLRNKLWECYETAMKNDNTQVKEVALNIINDSIKCFIRSAEDANNYQEMHGGCYISEKIEAYEKLLQITFSLNNGVFIDNGYTPTFEGTVCEEPTYIETDNYSVPHGLLYKDKESAMYSAKQFRHLWLRYLNN